MFVKSTKLLIQDFFDERKVFVSMITSVITNMLSPKIKGVLSNAENSRKLMNIINMYVDRNIEKLTTVGPVKRVLFTDVERDKVWNLIGLTPSVVDKAVAATTYIKEKTTPGNPFNILMTLIIRYYKIEKKTKEQNSSILYLTLSMYPSLHTKYFKFEPNEQIMAFTVQNMSNKFKLKQSGSLLQALSETTLLSDEHYSKELIRGNDKDIADYILSFKTRLNGMMKNICNEFMKQHKEKNYLNYEVDNEDENNFSVADSNSYLITRMTDAVVMKLSVQGPNSAIIVASAKMNDVSVNNLRNTVTAICKDKKSKEDLKTFISSILYLYVFDGSNDKENLHGNKFLLFSLDIYKRANTQDPNIIKIKEILNRWVDTYSEEYKKTNAVGTVLAFRKAVYTFFIFTIQRTET